MTVQAKLDMTVPDDAYEQEADTMADRVMRKVSFQGSVPPPSKGVSKSIGRTPSGFSSVSVSPALESSIASSRGGGFAMPSSLRFQMEAGFGVDLSDVRFHTGPAAARMSSSIQAKAFTQGKDVFFNEGQYNPDSETGQRLIAHELAHTLQQGPVVYRQADQDAGTAPAEQAMQVPKERRPSYWMYRRKELHDEFYCSNVAYVTVRDKYVAERKVVFLPYIERVVDLAKDFSHTRSEGSFFYMGVSFYFDQTPKQKAWINRVKSRLDTALALEFGDKSIPDDNKILQAAFNDPEIDFSYEALEKASHALDLYSQMLAVENCLNQLTLLVSDISSARGALGTFSAFMHYISPSRLMFDRVPFEKEMRIQRSLAGMLGISQEEVGFKIMAFIKEKDGRDVQGTDLTLDDYERYVHFLIGQLEQSVKDKKDSDDYWDEAIPYLQKCFGKEYVDNLEDLNNDVLHAQIATMATKGLLAILLIALCAPLATKMAPAATTGATVPAASAGATEALALTAFDMLINTGIEFGDQLSSKEGVNVDSLTDGAILTLFFHLPILQFLKSRMPNLPLEKFPGGAALTRFYSKLDQLTQSLRSRTLFGRKARPAETAASDVEKGVGMTMGEMQRRIVQLFDKNKAQIDAYIKKYVEERYMEGAFRQKVQNLYENKIQSAVDKQMDKVTDKFDLNEEGLDNFRSWIERDTRNGEEGSALLKEAESELRAEYKDQFELEAITDVSKKVYDVILDDPDATAIGFLGVRHKDIDADGVAKGPRPLTKGEADRRIVDLLRDNKEQIDAYLDVEVEARFDKGEVNKRVDALFKERGKDAVIEDILNGFNSSTPLNAEGRELWRSRLELEAKAKLRPEVEISYRTELRNKANVELVIQLGKEEEQLFSQRLAEVSNVKADVPVTNPVNLESFYRFEGDFETVLGLIEKAAEGGMVQVKD